MVNCRMIFTPFYTNTMKLHRFLHILKFLHFSDSMNPPNKNDKTVTMAHFGK